MNTTPWSPYGYTPYGTRAGYPTRPLAIQAVAQPLVAVGQAPNLPAPAGNPDVLTDSVGFLRTVPTLLLVGIVTGGAFAIGSGIVRILFPKIAGSK